jgi:hypothetical protein
MKRSPKAEDIYTQISRETTKLGDLRKLAKEIKKDHLLAMELWFTGEYLPRQLAILIMNPKVLSQELIDQAGPGYTKACARRKTPVNRLADG